MNNRRPKRKNADALSKRLRQKFYKGAALATSIYVVLSLVRFHGHFSYLPAALTMIWAIFLLCYTMLKEVFRWNDVGDEDIYHGELWAGLVVAGAAWMILWNLVRTWGLQLPATTFHADYEAATIETIVIYTLSTISSFLHKYRSAPKKARRHKARAGVKSMPGLEPRLLPATKKGLVEVVPTNDPNVEIMLTKSSPPEDPNP